VPDGHFVEANQAAFTGQDFRYTARGRYTMYAICIGRAGNEALLRSLGSNMKILTGEIADVKVLGSEEPVAWSRDADGLRVRVNDVGQFGMVLKLSLKEPAAGPPPSQVLQ
jgi:alpha-L-fucosidase